MNKLKSLADFITSENIKTAQDLGDAPGTATTKSVRPQGTNPGLAPPPVSGPAKPGTSGSNKSLAYAPEVKNLQESLKIFAKTVTGYSAAGASSVVTQGKKAFNDFITEGFMAAKPIKGVEWTEDHKVTDMAEKAKSQSDLFEMSAVVDGLSRLGSPKAEMQSDGVWGPRTANALNNIVAFAKALMDIDKRFTGQAPTSFTDKNLKFIEVISSVKASDFVRGQGHESVAGPTAAKFFQGKKIGTLAQAAADTVNALTKYYTEFLQRTLNNPKNAIFIQQDKPLDGVGKKDESAVLTEADKQALAQVEQDKQNTKLTLTVNISLPPDNVTKQLVIPLYFLTNKNRFKEFCAQQKITSDEGVSKVLQDIQAQTKRV